MEITTVADRRYMLTPVTYGDQKRISQDELLDQAEAVGPLLGEDEGKWLLYNSLCSSARMLNFPGKAIVIPGWKEHLSCFYGGWGVVYLHNPDRRGVYWEAKHFSTAAYQGPEIWVPMRSPGSITGFDREGADNQIIGTPGDPFYIATRVE